MEYTKNFYLKSDKLTSELCYEIDDLIEQVRYWKQKYEDSNLEHNKFVNDAIDHNKKMMENLLTATLKGCIKPIKNEKRKSTNS